jgi:septum formation topological specificity factor MinE
VKKFNPHLGRDALPLAFQLVLAIRSDHVSVPALPIAWNLTVLLAFASRASPIVALAFCVQQRSLLRRVNLLALLKEDILDVIRLTEKKISELTLTLETPNLHSTEIQDYNIRLRNYMSLLNHLTKKYQDAPTSLSQFCSQEPSSN